MTRLPSATNVLRAATVIAALVGAAPLRAQYATSLASIHERTGDFSQSRQVCGTGVTSDGLLQSISAVTVSYACAHGMVFGDATGGVLRFGASLTGEGARAPLFDPPYASNAAATATRVAQLSVGFNDVVTLDRPFTGTLRFFYHLTGDREELAATPPSGASPTKVETFASVSLLWGDGETDGAGVSLPLGVTDSWLSFDAPVVGSTLAYSLNGSAVVRLTSSMAGPTFALVGTGYADFTHTMQITRVAAIDASGADVTATTPFTSRVFTFGADGVVTGGRVLATPEPSTLALVLGGALVLVGVGRAAALARAPLRRLARSRAASAL